MAEDTRKFRYLFGITLLYLSLFASYAERGAKSSNRRHIGDNDLDVVITNDGPTTIGGRTTLTATITSPEQNKFEFCWFLDEYRTKENCTIATHSDTFVKSDWKSPGWKDVEVSVKQWPSPVRQASSCTRVLVTDTINCQLAASSSEVGPVNLSVILHDPSQLFPLSNILFSWNFGDGHRLSDKGRYSVVHNFTQDTHYKVNVSLQADVNGRQYNGSADTNLHLYVRFWTDASVTSAPGSKTTSVDGKIYVAKGPVTFTLLYNNPYFIVTNISTDWSFGDQSTSLHYTHDSIVHNFTQEREYSVWVTPRIMTKYSKHSLDSILKVIHIKEPITDFNVTDLATSDATMAKLNVTCKGSGPFKVCWNYIGTKLDHAYVTSSPPKCLWSAEVCNFVVTDRRKKNGGFLKVTLSSYVSREEVVMMIHNTGPTIIPKPQPQSPGVIAGETIAALFICSVALFIILMYGIRKLYKARQHAVLETADFDFRDEDCRSIDSVYLEPRRGCLSFGFLSGCRKKTETYALLDQCQNNSSSYSSIL
ncbi:predicted protein [Nematostella vectensis]|uniref:PKD domain-containing protein n=1 Tax=Nematostella vectensis TaxID=45351 RepID=A7SCP1_NEMVE|nr:predicted protein [Nematostella vectensis]|eukprot:XP_001630585.1 predicted protein [Nematostella vectensis]